MSDIERKYGVEESSDGDSSSGSVISAPTVAAAEEETEAEENPHSASDGAITAKHAYAVPSLLTAAPSSAAMSYPAMPITSHGIKGVPVDPGLAQSQDRLSALLDSIDSKRKREVPQAAASAAVAVESPYEWMRYKDPTTSLDYYYNIRTGVTQWERPAAFTESATSSSSSSSISTASSYGSASGYAYGLCGDAYSAQASFNKKAGSFAASGTTTYWEQVSTSYVYRYMYKDRCIIMYRQYVLTNPLFCDMLGNRLGVKMIALGDNWEVNSLHMAWDAKKFPRDHYIITYFYLLSSILRLEFIRAK